jgi:hypothetical protein
LPSLQAEEAPQGGSVALSFDHIWSDYIMPLAGQTVYLHGGKPNLIVSVTWGEVTRVTSNGRTSRIRIEIFREAVNHIANHGSVTREWINAQYVGRGSSGVVAILARVPLFELVSNPLGLKLRGDVDSRCQN